MRKTEDMNGGGAMQLLGRRRRMCFRAVCLAGRARGLRAARRLSKAKMIKFIT